MRVTRIIVDGREYVLPAEPDVADIMARITEQVRAGGGFVDLLDAPGRALSVLVSPGMRFSIEVHSFDEDHCASDFDDAAPPPSWFDPLGIT